MYLIPLRTFVYYNSISSHLRKEKRYSEVKLIKFPRGMASYSRSLTLLVPRCSHTSVSNTLRLYNRHRLIPRRYASQAAAIQSTSEVSAPSFTDLGVSPSLVQALKKTFPNVQIPTKSQRKFIPAVLSGRDVFLQNDTGTGKCVDCALLFLRPLNAFLCRTFGLILALLSKPREKMSFRKEAGLRGNTRPSTVLLITPHKELALQCMHWVESLHGALGGELSEHAVLVARGSGSTLDEQIRELKTHQPRLVIATPNALLDVLNDDPDALPPWSISTVAVDEVDTLIEHLSANARIYAIKKFERMLKKHPSPTRQILDRIYRISRPSTKDEEEGTSRGEVSSNGFRDSDQFRAQFVATSATLRSYFKNTLRKNTGWVTNRWSSIVDISGTAKGDLASINRLEPAPSDDKGLIQHSALIVHKDGKVVNIDGARVEKAPTLGVEPVGESEADESGLSDSPTEFSDRELEGLSCV